MTYFFETYGCQMNSAESSSVENLLVELGWNKSEQADLADLVIINTCSVRITAETRASGRIAHYSALKRKRPFTLIVMGCMAERLHDTFYEAYPGVDYAVGMFERNRFSRIFKTLMGESVPDETEDLCENAYFFAPSSYEKGSFQSYIPIMNGCNNFCSYCIVPYVRGREVSRPLPTIIGELDALADQGVREITLLGQNVNSYRWEDSFSGVSVDFPRLLERIAAYVKKRGVIKWIRFMSSHPKDLSDDLISVISRERAICRLIHLPVQHGSNAVLQAMNRKYSREHYLSLVEKIRLRIPDVSLSTDILVGFPGETEQDILDTLSLVREVGYDAAFMYHYNPREGTAAYTMANRVPDAVKKERLARVIALQHSHSARLMRERVGREVPVLVESTSRNDKDELFGHTERGEMVVFSGKGDKRLIGHFVLAQLLGLRGRTFRAKILKTELEAPDVLETDQLFAHVDSDNAVHRL